MRALTTNWQTFAMSSALVRADLDLPLDVGLDVAAEVALEHPLVVGDEVQDLVQLLLGQVLRPHVGVQARFLNELIGPRGPDPVDVTQGVRDFLLRGNFNAEETRHDEERMG